MKSMKADIDEVADYLHMYSSVKESCEISRAVTQSDFLFLPALWRNDTCNSPHIAADSADIQTIAVRHNLDIE